MTYGIDQIAAIWDIVERHYGYDRGALKAAGRPPFDLSRDNIHVTKAEFLAEFAAIKAAAEQTKGLLGFLESSFRTVDRDIISRRVTAYIDERSYEEPFEYDLKSVHNLILKNVIETGVSSNLFFILIEFDIGLRKRKQELTNQEAIFWAANHRSANPFARSIALRFAQWVAVKTGKRPTFGTAAEGGHPSTDFGRALEEVFKVLGIAMSPKLPAKWAIKKVKDELTDEFVLNVRQENLDEINHAKNKALDDATNLDAISKMLEKGLRR